MSELSTDDSQYVPLLPFSAWVGEQFDSSSFENEFDELELVRADSTAESLHAVGQILIREAAVTTGAVESLYLLELGETRTIALKTPGWEGGLVRQGEGKAQLFLDQVAAYEQIWELAKSRDPLLEYVVREVHKIVSRSQRTYTARVVDPLTGTEVPTEIELRRGEYKEYPNHVVRRDGSTLFYCPVVDTAEEMRRFAAEINSDDFRQASPLLQATYVHYGVVHIHPFSDGNGRVARVLASYFLLQKFGIPLIVYPDRRLKYFQSLDSAHKGGYRYLVEYLVDRATETAGRARQELRRLNGVALEEELLELDTLIRDHADVSIETVEELGSHLRNEILEMFRSQAVELEERLDGSLESEVGWDYGGSSPATDFVIYRAGKLTLTLLRPAKVAHTVYVGIFRARDLSARFAFRVGAMQNIYTTADDLTSYADLRFEDVSPSLSESARPRVSLAVDEAIRMGLTHVRRSAEETLSQAGYEDS